MTHQLDVPLRDGPVTVAVVNDYELVVAGVARLLEPFHERVVVVETEAGGVIDRPVDVALIDTFASLDNGFAQARDLLDGHLAGAVVFFTAEIQPAVAMLDVLDGVAGVISKALSAERLVAALEAAASGRKVVEFDPDQRRNRRSKVDIFEPLSDREAEVLALIAEGYTNAEIARSIHVSPETVKTYVSRAFTKINAKNRAQAAAWSVSNGLQRANTVSLSQSG